MKCPVTNSTIQRNYLSGKRLLNDSKYESTIIRIHTKSITMLYLVLAGIGIAQFLKRKLNHQLRFNLNSKLVGSLPAALRHSQQLALQTSRPRYGVFYTLPLRSWGGGGRDKYCLSAHRNAVLNSVLIRTLQKSYTYNVTPTHQKYA